MLLSPQYLPRQLQVLTQSVEAGFGRSGHNWAPSGSTRWVSRRLRPDGSIQHTHCRILMIRKQIVLLVAIFSAPSTTTSLDMFRCMITTTLMNMAMGSNADMSPSPPAANWSTKDINWPLQMSCSVFSGITREGIQVSKVRTNANTTQYKTAFPERGWNRGCERARIVASMVKDKTMYGVIHRAFFI